MNEPRKKKATRVTYRAEWSMGYDAKDRFEFIVGDPLRGHGVKLTRGEALNIAHMCLVFAIEQADSVTRGPGPAKVGGRHVKRKAKAT